MSSSVRAFLSVDVVDAALRERVKHIQERIDTRAARIKFVEIENIHFTLRFLGETPVQRIDEIQNVLRELSHTPFTIRIEGIGAFPSIRRPNVIWVGVTEGRELLQSLKSEIDGYLSQLGYPSEPRFKGHLTIARVRSVLDRSRLITSLQSLKNEAVGTMSVTSVRMKKSTLTPRGPIYETLWEIPLDSKK